MHVIVQLYLLVMFCLESNGSDVNIAKCVWNGPRHYTYIRETKGGGLYQSSATAVHKSPNLNISGIVCIHAINDLYPVDGITVACNLTE